jgi:heat shock protein HtpX
VKRVLLLVATNFAIVILLSMTARLLGLDRYLESNGSLNLQSLLVFCAIFGFGGAFISLAISKWMAKFSTGAQVITQPRNQAEAWLLDTVSRQAQASGIKMPEVAVYDSPELNAFATGPSRNNALVAVSTGLLHNMRPDEVEAVLAHEISHVANGDMVTLTLIQGVVNTFVMFIARIVGNVVDKVILKNEEGHGPAFYITTIIAELVLGVLASIIVMWFSRQREFRADAGAAKLVGATPMINALERLKLNAEGGALPDGVKALGISGRPAFTKLFMSHPPLDERIAALRNVR